MICVLDPLGPASHVVPAGFRCGTPILKLVDDKTAAKFNKPARFPATCAVAVALDSRADSDVRAIRDQICGTGCVRLYYGMIGIRR